MPEGLGSSQQHRAMTPGLWSPQAEDHDKRAWASRQWLAHPGRGTAMAGNGWTIQWEDVPGWLVGTYIGQKAVGKKLGKKKAMVEGPSRVWGCFFQLLGIGKFTVGTAYNFYPFVVALPSPVFHLGAVLICIEWWSLVCVYSSFLFWLHTLLSMKITCVTDNSGFQKIFCFLIIRVMYSCCRTFGKKKKLWRIK